MRPLADDTPEDVERAQAAIWTQLPPERRLGLVFDLCAQARALSLAGILGRNPGLDARAALRIYADQCLGPALAARAYGPLPGAAVGAPDGR